MLATALTGKKAAHAGRKIMSKFRKKPVVIEAVQFDPCKYQDILDWIGSAWPNDHNAPAGVYGNNENGVFVAVGMWIKTLEGKMDAMPQDWIIRGIKGEFYPCKPDIFAATYEPAD
jgi:hypothetical protein